MPANVEPCAWDGIRFQGRGPLDHRAPVALRGAGQQRKDAAVAQNVTAVAAGVRIGRLSVGLALWDCVSRVCGGGVGCAGGGAPLGAVLVLSWCGEVFLGSILIISI